MRAGERNIHQSPQYAARFYAGGKRRPAKIPSGADGTLEFEVTMRYYLHLTEKMQEKGSDIVKRMFQDEKSAPKE